MNRHLRIGLALTVLAFSSPSLSFAQTGPVIRNSVSVCDPSAPTHCEKPNAAGAIPISGTISATNPSVGTNGATAPTSSTQIGVLIGANLQPASSSNPVPVSGSITCLNCSGSGAASTDQTTFTAGTSVFAPSGVFFQTTATNNPLTNGQQGMLQSTAQRAAFTNLRNASGTEVGTSTTPLQVTVANTGANATAIKVDGSAVTQPTSLATLPALTAGSAVIGHVIADTGSTTAVTALPAIPAGTNVIGHIIADTGSTTAVTALPSIPAGVNVIGHVIADSGSTTAVTGTVAVTQSGTWTVQPGNTANTTAWKVDGSSVTQPVSAASLPLPTGAATSAKQPALGTAGTASTDVITVQGIAGGVAQPVSAASLPLPALAATSTKQSDGSQKTQIVDGSGNVVATTSNNLNVQCANCTGSGVSAVDGASFTAGASVFAPTGVFYQTTATSNALTTGQQGMIQGTAQRAAFVNLRNASGAEIGVAATPVQVSLANTAVNGTAIAVNCTTGCSSGTVSNASSGVATSSTNGANNSWLYGFNGTTWDQLQVDGSKYLKVSSQTATPAGTNVIGKVSIDQTTLGTTNGVALTQVGSTTVLTGGVNGSQGVGGLAANNATASGNPLQQSCIAVSAEATLATAAQNASCVSDLAHKQIVLPYANPENFVSGNTAAMTGTTSTVLIASPGGSLRNYITQLSCVNSHATQGTFVNIQDGSGGTTIYTVAAAAVYGGTAITFPVPLRQPSTATGLYVVNATTGANVVCSASGYKGV